MQCDVLYCNTDKYYIEHHGASMATLSRNDAVMMNVMTLTKTIDGDVVILFVGRVIYKHYMYKIGTVANIRWRRH